FDKRVQNRLFMRRCDCHRRKAALGKILNYTREVLSRPLLGRKSSGRMNKRDLSIRESDCFESLIYVFSGLRRDAQHRSRSISNRNAGPTEQGELLFDGMSLLLSPKQQGRGRLVIMKLRVLISLETNAMTSAGSSRQKSRRCT